MLTVTRPTRLLLASAITALVVFLYLPILTVLLASFSPSRYFSFPLESVTGQWYGRVFDSLSIRDIMATSLTIALLVAAIATVLALFGALAFARFRWQGRSFFQKLILLPIFMPQAVLGLALLLWFSALGITPSWKTAVFAHLVWIAPVATLIVSIQVYGFDPALEEAAFDMGASRLQVFTEVTLPLLAPGLVSGFIFSFLLSWSNFALSMFTTGADQTVPGWLSAKMQSGYTPQVPALASVTTAVAFVLLFAGYALFQWHLKRRAAAEAALA
jgi:spermidine/putrescine transport system permease protein